jgi:hypothetical protein
MFEIFNILPSHATVKSYFSKCYLCFKLSLLSFSVIANVTHTKSVRIGNWRPRSFSLSFHAVAENVYTLFHCHMWWSTSRHSSETTLISKTPCRCSLLSCHRIGIGKFTAWMNPSEVWFPTLSSESQVKSRHLKQSSCVHKPQQQQKWKDQKNDAMCLWRRASDIEVNLHTFWIYWKKMSLHGFSWRLGGIKS